MKTLIVYYSFEGNTEFIAKAMAEAIGADLLKLQPKKEIPTKGFMKYFWGGRQAMMKMKPELLPLEKNPADYDFIILGTPVWAFTYSPPLATYFSQRPFKNKRIALFCCHGGGKAGTLRNMKEALKGNTFVGEIDFIEPLRGKTQKKKEMAVDWVNHLSREMTA